MERARSLLSNHGYDSQKYFFNTSFYGGSGTRVQHRRKYSGWITFLLNSKITTNSSLCRWLDKSTIQTTRTSTRTNIRLLQRRRTWNRSSGAGIADLQYRQQGTKSTDYRIQNTDGAKHAIKGKRTTWPLIPLNPPRGYVGNLIVIKIKCKANNFTFIFSFILI